MYTFRDGGKSVEEAHFHPVSTLDEKTHPYYRCGSPCVRNSNKGSAIRRHRCKYIKSLSTQISFWAKARAMEDQKSTEQVVTPWDVSGGADGRIDYNKLVEQFGCQTIHQELIERIEKVTGVPSHPFLKRRVFFAHRDLEELLDAYEKGEPFYLYTGRVSFELV